MPAVWLRPSVLCQKPRSQSPVSSTQGVEPFERHPPGQHRHSLDDEGRQQRFHLFNGCRLEHVLVEMSIKKGEKLLAAPQGLFSGYPVDATKDCEGDTPARAHLLIRVRDKPEIIDAALICRVDEAR